MKAFKKALLPALLSTIFIVTIAIVSQWILFDIPFIRVIFEGFFGVVIGKFNPLPCLIVFVVLWLIFTLIFRSYYEEELK